VSNIDLLHDERTKEISSRGVTARLFKLSSQGGLALAALATLTLVLASISTPALAGTDSKLSRAVSIAAQSRTNVVTLHDLAVSVGEPMPPEKVIRVSVQGLEVTFAKEAKACKAIGASASSPTGILAASLLTYGNLATEVVAATKEKHPSMTAGFTKALKANDKKWLKALTALGKADHVNLLKEIPTLLYPKTKK